MTRSSKPARILLLLLALSAPGIAKAEGSGRRLALVIGNNDYIDQPILANAIGDAHAVRDTLASIGFDVQMEENLSLSEVWVALATFEEEINPSDTVAFFFSGHGVAVNGRNYLLPVDFPPLPGSEQVETVLRQLAVNAGSVVADLSQTGAALTFAILDACRDNPLGGNGRSVGLPRGLVHMDPPSGVFVLFSAGSGEVALDRLGEDDVSPTSVFTRNFLPVLQTPGLTLVDIAKKTQVAVSVMAATIHHEQFPDYADRVLGDVVLVPQEDPAEPEPLEPPKPPLDESVPSPHEDTEAARRLEEFERREQENARQDPLLTSRLRALYTAYAELTESDRASAGALATRISEFERELGASNARIEAFPEVAPNAEPDTAFAAYDDLSAFDKILYQLSAPDQEFISVCQVERNLALEIQRELRGCKDPSVIVVVNGAWGPRSVATARQFLAEAILWGWTEEEFDVTVPSLQLLSLVRKIRAEGYGPVCPNTGSILPLPLVNVEEACDQLARSRPEG